MTMLRERATTRTKTIAVLALPVVLIVAFVLASYTSLFRVRDVRVEGAATIPRERVLELAGIGPDTNVFHLDTGSAEAALITDPWISSAIVERHLPGTVVIRIQERSPMARAILGAATVVLAGDGVVLPGAPTAGLPDIRASIGELSDDARTSAARALSALDPILRGRVATVVAQPTGELVMNLAGGLRVRYGTAGEEAEKAASLRAVLSWAAGEGEAIRDVDVTVPEAPSATLVDGSTVTP
jgi:cell division protein FtsQ